MTVGVWEIWSNSDSEWPKRGHPIIFCSKGPNFGDFPDPIQYHIAMHNAQYIITPSLLIFQRSHFNFFKDISIFNRYPRWKKTLIIVHHVGLLFVNQWYPIYMRNINIFSREKWRQAKLRPRRQFIIESRFNCRKVNLIFLKNMSNRIFMFQINIIWCWDKCRQFSNVIIPMVWKHNMHNVKMYA